MGWSRPIPAVAGLVTSAGVAIPLFFKAQSARISAAKLDWERNQRQAEYIQRQLGTEQLNAFQQVQKYSQSLAYYQNQGLANADVIIATADQQFQGGEIDYLQWVILVNQAISIRNEYVNSLSNYNQAVIHYLKLNNL
ncbi:hypothetical protein GO730_35155 [Spirosoma sp. HMF3257]|uniref:TolC family protein n=1 Tax=Spirosoma telluris TaxID=2183553 RepID=A0A327NTH4_9BACT|nr:hypothetical protein [Spirosoma telluris]RAI78015.1 hypothetical protein HMF3257_35055 [Spirosoma telluris]